MSTYTPDAAALERVNTHALRTGDTLRHHDMRIILGERGERHDPGTGRLVVWFHGLITNPEAVRDIPESWRTAPVNLGNDYAPGAYWLVQGNDLATWTREIPAPTCAAPGDNHSPDLIEVHSGRPEPVTVCGYHLTRDPALTTIRPA